jgi:glycosyltransferase involved in cell wall biosynthesis
MASVETRAASPDRSTSRIVHVTTVHRSQDPRIFRKQLRSLSEAGFDAHLIAPHPNEGVVDGIPIHALERRRGRLRRLTLQPSALRKSVALQADLYHFHDPELIPCMYLVKQATGACIVYDMHEDYASRGGAAGSLLRLLETWCFRWVDHVVTAEAGYDPILEGQPVSHTLIANYHRPFNGDIATAKEGKQSEGTEDTDARQPRRLLYTGTIANDRGLDVMLDVAEAIRERDRPERLCIAGVCNRSGELRAAERRYREQGLAHVVDRIGWDQFVLPKNLAPHYRSADVGLALLEPHPNYVQSFPTKFYEYLHHGLPFICTDIPLWRSFVEENDCGAVVPPNDPEAVLQVLDRWNRNPERFRKLQQNARQAAKKYRWSQMAERLVGLYDRLLGLSNR